MKKVGVIGAGYWGRNLARNFNALDALAAICDPNEGTRKSIGEQYPDARQYEKVSELFADSSIDAVAIAVPAVTHGSLVREAIRAKKAVFVEKPLCLDLHEAKEFKQSADEAGLVLIVGHLLLYHPAFTSLQTVVREGLIGKLRYIYSTRLSLGKIRREENALWSFAPHDITMILALTEQMPVEIVANGAAYLSEGVADTTLSHFTFSENLQAHIFVSWLHPFKDHRMIVVGSERMIVLDDVRDGAEKLMHYPQSYFQKRSSRSHRAEGNFAIHRRKKSLGVGSDG